MERELSKEVRRARPRTIANPYYRAVRLLLRALIPIVSRVDVRGLDNIPAIGPCLLVGNHLSMVDVFFLSYVRRHVYFLALADLFEVWPLSFLLPFFEPIKLHRGRPDRAALREAERRLRQGEVVMIYAEGMRSLSAQALEARAGAVFLARRTDCPIVPVALSGTEKLFGGRFPWYRRARVQLTFGSAFRIADLDPAIRSDRDRAAQAIMARVALLLPPAYRGVYADGETRRRAFPLDASRPADVLSDATPAQAERKVEQELAPLDERNFHE